MRISDWSSDVCSSDLKQFFGSMTTLRPEAVGDAEMARILALVGIDPATLDPDGDDNDRLVILRHTLMNPYLIDHTTHISYIERYLDHLAPHLRAMLASSAATPPCAPGSPQHSKS